MSSSCNLGYRLLKYWANEIYMVFKTKHLCGGSFLNKMFSCSEWLENMLSVFISLATSGERSGL